MSIFGFRFRGFHEPLIISSSKMNTETKETKKDTDKKYQWTQINPSTHYNKATWLVVDYVQKQIKEQNFTGSSFWWDLGRIANAHPDSMIVVTEKESNEFAGFAILRYETPPVIRMVEVAPKYRRCKLGTWLVLAVCNYFTKNMPKENVLYTPPLNERAEPFFKALGFKNNNPGLDGRVWCVEIESFRNKNKK
jgi:GNAT superfamily N-acetyltransferase